MLPENKPVKQHQKQTFSLQEEELSENQFQQ
jgi:hypothetical protein